MIYLEEVLWSIFFVLDDQQNTSEAKKNIVSILALG